MDGALHHSPEREAENGEQQSLLQGMHILVAEDNEINAEILGELLDMAGATCDICEMGPLHPLHSRRAVQDVIHLNSGALHGHLDVLADDLLVVRRQEPGNAVKQLAHYRFIVTDNGYGMSPEYQQKIFHAFTREEDSVTNKIQGTGLGMAITKNLLDLMGGKIVPLGFHLGADDGVDVLNEVHHVLVRQVQHRLAGLDLADVQHVVDEPQQVLAGGGDLPGVLLARSKETAEQAFQIAEEANRAKSAFLSNMSHDIRTPMNAIVGFAALLARDAENPEKVREYTRKITASSQHLLGLINDVLDISKRRGGRGSSAPPSPPGPSARCTPV